MKVLKSYVSRNNVSEVAIALPEVGGLKAVNCICDLWTRPCRNSPPRGGWVESGRIKLSSGYSSPVAIALPEMGGLKASRLKAIKFWRGVSQ